MIYVWCASQRSALVHADIIDAGFVPNYQIIWNKSSFVIGRGDYHWKHEPCWYATRKGKKHNWQGSRSETTVWDIGKPSKSETGHSTQKPIECMARPIRNNSAEGDFVYDPFIGSGSTMVACEELGRKCLGIEIDPNYCAVILERLLNLGLEPKRIEAAKSAAKS